MTNRSWEQTAEQPLDVLAEQYRAELERLNYGRATINVYLRTIRKLGQLIGSHDLPSRSADAGHRSRTAATRRLAWRSAPVCHLCRQALRRLSHDARPGETAGAADGKGACPRRVAA
jgi:hypothetical protein